MQVDLSTDEYYMRQALKQAQLAFDMGEVPIGAVVVDHQKIIAKGHNMVELLKDSTAHAEMLALTAAYQLLGAKYLPEATLYVTVEPCLMCCGALFWGKVSRIVFGAYDEKNGYRRFTQSHSTLHPFHPKAQITGGVLQQECTSLMQAFFKMRR